MTMCGQVGRGGAAGPWWAGGPGQPPGQTPYMFLLDPTNLGQPTQTDKAAMAVLQPHFADLQPGDFNFDGTVDAADYTIWRDSRARPAPASTPTATSTAS